MTSSTLKAISIAAFMAALGACSSRVTVNDPTIPNPLVDKIPISVAVRFPDVFEHFIHEEQVIGKEKWTIDLGQSNALLFTKLFHAMFNDLTVVDDSVDPHEMSFDALIEPSIDAFEFSVPSQSQTDAFAVWIRYRIKIFDSEGNQYANWPISAYGKSQSTTMGRDDALRRAAVLAMRDAAALIIMQMDKATGISKLNNKPLSSVAAGPEPELPEPGLPEPGLPEPGLPEPGLPEPELPGPELLGPELLGPELLGPVLGPELLEPELLGPELPEPGLLEPIEEESQTAASEDTTDETA